MDGIDAFCRKLPPYAAGNVVIACMVEKRDDDGKHLCFVSIPKNKLELIQQNKMLCYCCEINIIILNTQPGREEHEMNES